MRIDALLVTDFVVPQKKRVPAWSPPQAAAGGRFGEFELDEDVLNAQRTIDPKYTIVSHEGGDGSF